MKRKHLRAELKAILRKMEEVAGRPVAVHVTIAGQPFEDTVLKGVVEGRRVSQGGK